MRNNPVSLKQIQERQMRTKTCSDMSLVSMTESLAVNANDKKTKCTLIESVFSKCDNSEAADTNIEKLVNHINEATEERHKDSIVNTFCNEVLPTIGNFDKAREAIFKISDTRIMNKCLDKVSEAAYCDRILSNDKKISKRFGADVYIREHQYINDVEKLYKVMCEWINTYNMPYYAKLSTALDEMSYLLQKNGIKYDSKEMTTFITEYFLLSKGRSENSTVKSISNALTSDMCITENDICDIQYLFEDVMSDGVKDIIDKCKKQEKIDENSVKRAINSIYARSPEDIINGTPNILAWMRQMIVLSTLGLNVVLGLVVIITDKLIQLALDRKSAKRALKIFRDEHGRVQNMIDKETDIDKEMELEKYLDTIDKSIAKIEEYAENICSDEELSGEDDIYESVSMNAPISIEEFKMFKFNSILNMATNAGKYVKDAYNGAISKIKGKIKKVKDNDIDKDGKAIKKGAVKFNGFKTADIFLGHFTESTGVGVFDTTIVSIYYEDCNMLEASELAYEICKDLSGKNEGARFYSKTSGSVNEIHMVCETPVILSEDDRNTIMEGMSKDDAGVAAELLVYTEAINKLAATDPCNIIPDLIKSNADSKAAYAIIDMQKYIGSDGVFTDDDTWSKLKNRFIMPYNESDSNDEYIEKVINNNLINHASYNFKSEEYPLDIQTEAYQIMRSVITEGIDGSSVKLALQGMKDKIKTLSTKEREASNNIDIMANGFVKNVEAAMTNDRREGIIQGSLVPSFSKCIKAAIGLAAIGVIVDPVCAVIALFGSLAMSKKLNDRERMLMFDEIETELTVVGKELQIAESNNDMTKYRKLLTYQKKLKKESFKLRYKLSKKTKRDFITRVNSKEDDD